ncbi:MAG: hypothetical protein EBZ77_08240, partial [Chitinophagia bacterium]|nr:hypothetical protein [Chitinophagia bacterium]
KSNNPMVVWGDDAGKAWFSRWGGEAFTTPEQLNTPGSQVYTSSWAGPDIAGRGDTVYVVYKALPVDKGHIYITHSYDAGLHFAVPDQVETDKPGLVRAPIVTADNAANPFVSYIRANADESDARIMVNRSDDLGESFKGEVQGSILYEGLSCECSPPSLAVSGNAAILLYRSVVGAVRNIYASLSAEGGQRFNYGLQVDSTRYKPASCPQSGADCEIVGDNVYGVYSSGDGDNGLAYLLTMPLSKKEFRVRPITGPVAGVVMQSFPRLSGAANAAAVVWTQTAAGNNQVCMSFSDNLSQGFPSVYDTVAEGVMVNADVAVGGGYVYVVWEDHVNRCVMFRRGVYTARKAVVENSGLIIQPPAEGQKYFFVNQEGVLSCTLTDEKGNHFEMDFTYPNGNNFCKVATDDLEPGVYTVTIQDSEGRTLNGRVELK